MIHQNYWFSKQSFNFTTIFKKPHHYGKMNSFFLAWYIKGEIMGPRWWSPYRLSVSYLIFMFVGNKSYVLFGFSYSNSNFWYLTDSCSNKVILIFFFLISSRYSLIGATGGSPHRWFNKTGTVTFFPVFYKTTKEY